MRIVYIVDDDDMAIWLYRNLLRDVNAQIRPFQSARRFLHAYRAGPCECLICDLRMPELDGLEVQRTLVSTGNTLPIIFVSGYSKVPSVVTAIKTGAFDFLEKPVDGSQLVALVEAALERSVGLHQQRLEQSAIHARLALLTPKEREIVDYVIAGYSSREISSALGNSVRTIENHRARISDKLRVGSTVELVRLFARLP